MMTLPTYKQELLSFLENHYNVVGDVELLGEAPQQLKASIVM
jgi:hypothetical protein